MPLTDPVCARVRKQILRVSHASGHGHIPTSFSIVEMLVACHSVMKHDPKNPDDPDSDLFVLSKGHGSLAYYCVLSQLGYVEPASVDQFGAHGSAFGCHPDRLKIPGVRVSTGSLGHGIGVAVGMALALRIQKRGNRVFTLIGDGESNEGSVWEAILVAVAQKLDNLTVLYDGNRSQSRCLQIENPAAHFAGFGADVEEVDGHDLKQMEAALRRRTVGKLRVVVCHTRKGAGSATMEKGHHEWHRRSPKPEELTLLQAELEASSGGAA